MEAKMTYYSRKIEMPKTKREGLENFVQMIINRLEAGENQEALLQAVDLVNDVRSGIYDNAMADALGYNEMAKELREKHVAELSQAELAGYQRGVAAEQARITKALGLLT
jgi:hypothetical protein